MRSKRWVALGLVALAIPAFAMPLLAQGGGSTTSSKIEALLTQLDGDGDVSSVRTTGLLRIFADGSFSVDDGGNTVTGDAKGSKDFPFDRELTLDNGLIKTPSGVRALPVTVK